MVISRLPDRIKEMMDRLSRSGIKSLGVNPNRFISALIAATDSV